MDMLALLVAAGVLLIVAGVLLVSAGLTIERERRLDDPGYRARHFARSTDELERSVADSRRSLRRSPAPWSPSPQRHSDVNP